MKHSAAVGTWLLGCGHLVIQQIQSSVLATGEFHRGKANGLR
jgi:hypothetical protein